MKRIVLISLLLFSCTKEIVIKEETTSQSTCNCHEEHYQKGVGQGQTGNLIIQWEWNYATTPQPDLCEKQTGQWVEYDNGNKRYKVICN